MNDSTRGLLTSLVGYHIEFKFSSTAGITSLDNSVQLMRTRIQDTCEKIQYLKGSLGLALLAEMYHFYKSEAYFSAVRGAFSFHRLLPKVVEYLSLTVEERLNKLLSLLKGCKEHRYYVVAAIGYFCKTYPNRLKQFRPLLTKEEFLNIA